MPPIKNPAPFYVTENLVKAKIINEKFTRLEGCTGTICILTLQNGFVVTGESFCVDPVNFDQEIGKLLARKDAVAKIWPLEGYLAAERNYLDRIMKP